MISLKIDFDPQTGRLSVVGCIDNKLVAYGLLELARDVVRQHDPDGQAKKVIDPARQPAEGAVLLVESEPDLHGRNGGRP